MITQAQPRGVEDGESAVENCSEPSFCFVAIYHHSKLHKVNLVGQQLRQWLIAYRATRQGTESEAPTAFTRPQGVFYDPLFLWA
ncbi:MAG: hypothetical protein ACK56K_03360 [Akkermansiaceae bacterium]